VNYVHAAKETGPAKERERERGMGQSAQGAVTEQNIVKCI
jgi:hypothetical protein